MTDQLNIWVVLYSCGFAMGLFMTLLFVVFRKKYAGQTINVGITFFIMSLLLLSEILEESGFVDSYPIIITIGTVLDLLLWPFLLFYVQSIVEKKQGIRWTDGFYFIPFVIALLWQTRLAFLPAEIQLNYYSGGIPADIAKLVTFKMLTSFGFLFYILHLLNASIKAKSGFVMSRHLQFVVVTKKFFVGLTVLISLIFLLFFNQYFEILRITDSDRISSLILSGLFYFFALQIFKNPHLLEDEQYPTQVRQFFDGNEGEYVRTLTELLESQKVYLNERLTVQLVADELKLSSQQLSYLINKELGVSFNDLINSYRVKEVQERIKSDVHQSKTLLGLALESGFNSKASFNRIFKNHTGISPSVFFKKEVSNQK